MFTFVRVTGYIPHRHLYEMCHIAFTWRVYDLTAVWGGGGDGSGVTGASAFIAASSQDMSEETSGHFQLVFVDQKRNFKLKPWSLPNRDQVVFVSKSIQSKRTALSRHKIENCTERNVKFNKSVVSANIQFPHLFCRWLTLWCRM